MLKWIKEKEHVAKWTGKKSICKVVLRVCDRCGKEDEVRLVTFRASRKNRNSENDYCYGCTQRVKVCPTGKDYAKWKHGLTYNGYVRITVNKHRLLEHVHVMQEHLQRQMEKGETIHHIDMDKTNNDLNNLYLFKSQSDHQSCHISMEKCGVTLLDKLIWFDRDNKEYTLKMQKNLVHVDVDTTDLKDLKFFKKTINHSETFYWFAGCKDEFGKWQLKAQHSFIAEKLLKRPLYKNECVHHIDGNGLNNDLKNICVLTRREHAACHCSLQRIVADLYKQNIVLFENGVYSILKGI